MTGPRTRAGLDTAAVVDAAAVLADADGLDRLTLAALAQRLGVRAPSLYVHIDGLSDLRSRLAVRGCGQLHDALASAAAGRAGLDALSAVAEAYRDFALAHPGLYAATQSGLGEDPRVDAAATAVAEVIFAVMRGYGLVGEDAVHAVRAIRSALHGFVVLHERGGFAMSADREESFRRMVALLHAGLAVE